MSTPSTHSTSPRGEAYPSRRPLPLRAHAMAEPLVVAAYVAGPWIFGFDDVSDAKTISVILGVVALIGALTTRWRAALVKVLPLRAHEMTDIALGAVAILSPFVFGFSDEGGPTRFLIIMGVLHMGAALMTRWDDTDDFAVSTVETPARRA